MTDHDDDHGAEGGGPPVADEVRDHVRAMVGRIALDVGTTPEGRAAGLSIEVWPEAGIWLRVRSGHELRISAAAGEPGVEVRWERIDPQPEGAHHSEGDLGLVEAVTEDELRAFVMRWLSWRARG